MLFDWLQIDSLKQSCNKENSFVQFSLKSVEGQIAKIKFDFRLKGEVKNTKEKIMNGMKVDSVGKGFIEIDLKNNIIAGLYGHITRSSKQKTFEEEKNEVVFDTYKKKKFNISQKIIKE